MDHQDGKMSAWTDNELLDWVWQYSGSQAGYYPALRRQRVQADREVVLRGLEKRPQGTRAEHRREAGFDWPRL